MTLADILHEMADTLSHLPEFSGVRVLEESKGDIINDLESQLAAQNISAVVAWNGFTPNAQGNDGLHGSAALVVQIFENPTIHRSQPGALPCLTLAEAAARALSDAAAEGMTDTLHLKRITPIAVLERGVISCNVEFSTEIKL